MIQMNKFYKRTIDGYFLPTNLLYTPFILDDGNKMCMKFVEDKEYQPNSNVHDDVRNWFFERELLFLQQFQHFSFVPKLYDFDIRKKEIYIEFNNETLSEIINDGTRNIDQEVKNWKDDCNYILETLIDSKYYKMALYPHCFFITKEGKLKTIDFYSIVPFNERYIERKKIESIIGKDGAYRFDESTNDGIIDFEKFFKITIIKHLDKTWKINPFNKFLERVKW